LNKNREEKEGVQALEGIKVLDLSKYAPGPYCTMILGDLGADVIKVEEFGSPKGRRAEQMKGIAKAPIFREFASPNSPFNPLDRNKRSIALNLKMAMGQRIFYQLVERADVVVEGFRPGVTKRLGIDYETLKEINKQIIYCAITGYGQNGPYRDLVGHDINYISQGGAVDIMSQPGAHPPIPGNLIGDMAAGGMQGAIGILAALMARIKTGRGQFVDIAMTDGVVSLLSLYLGGHFQYGELRKQEDRITTGATHSNDYYRTKDGKFISIACAAEPWFYANLCKALGCEEFIPYQTDLEKADEIKAFFEQKFLTKTRDEWFNILSPLDIPVGKAYKLDELASDPQILHRRMILDLDHPVEGKVRQAGISIKLSETPGTVRRLGQALGENTEEILAEIGYSREEIKKLRNEGIVGTGSAPHIGEG
jgi:crotonobetainyl-CoA:carnitine CoA-transferase CaiB-like acyl-CoA transferase